MEMQTRANVQADKEVEKKKKKKASEKRSKGLKQPVKGSTIRSGTLKDRECCDRKKFTCRPSFVATFAGGRLWRRRENRSKLTL